MPPSRHAAWCCRLPPRRRPPRGWRCGDWHVPCAAGSWRAPHGSGAGARRRSEDRRSSHSRGAMWASSDHERVDCECARHARRGGRRAGRSRPSPMRGMGRLGFPRGGCAVSVRATRARGQRCVNGVRGPTMGAAQSVVCFSCLVCGAGLMRRVACYVEQIWKFGVGTCQNSDARAYKTHWSLDPAALALAQKQNRVRTRSRTHRTVRSA